MATGEQVVNPELDVRTDTATYCLVQLEEKDSDGNAKVQFAVEKAAEKLVEDKKGVIVMKQSFETVNAGTDAAFNTLVPTEKERVRLANRGLDQKQYQLIRTKMLETDAEGNYVFAPKEGKISLRKEVAEEMASRATSPEAKFEKILDGLDDAAAASILTKLLAKVQGS